MPKSKPAPNIHVMTVGTRPSSSGEVVTFSSADLAATAGAYDPKKHEAPLVIGHPKTDAPAYGWVQALSFGADGLTATPFQVDPAFAELHAAGRYKKVSGSFYRPDSPHNPVPGVYYLRHIGFLGAEPPAEKGLRDPVLRTTDFADADDCITVEFGEVSDEPKTPTPDTPLPPAGEGDKTLLPPPSPSGTPAPTPEDTTVTPEEAARLAKENADLKAQLDAANAAQAKAAADAMHAANAQFAEKLVNEARIPAEGSALIVEMLDFAQRPDTSGETVQFGEGDAVMPMHEALRKYFSNLPPMIQFGEVATKDRAGVDVEAVDYAEGADPERVEADKKIRAYMKQHNVDYTTAARAVMK